MTCPIELPARGRVNVAVEMAVAASSESSVHVQLLSRVPFLTQVSHENLEQLAQGAVVRNFDPHRPVISQGKFGHSMFVLVQGTLTITATGTDGLQLFLGRLDQPGQFFGEVALLGRGVRSATVATEAPTTLLEIEKNLFERIARRHDGVLEELEKYYHARAIGTYVRLHRYLTQLDEPTMNWLLDGASMRKYKRDEVVCRTGDPTSHVMLIKDGVLKMVRKGADGRMSILAYFNTDDVAGAHDPAQRSYDLVALGQAEVIFLDRTKFNQLAQSHPHIFDHFGKDDMHRQEALHGASQTVYGAVEAFLKEGVEVESLLVINLDRCVRCGNCVRACHSRHQFTRLDRRGPIFRRRKSVASTRHEHLMIPSSCRHCRDPECMIGCPTGAIQRFPNGDVDINDNCIGCENCARKCPYGNITMRPLPPDQQRENIVKRAIKCNLCRGYAYSNCVHECPRGAVLRVDPLRYFDELAMVMESEQQQAIAWQREQAEQASAFGKASQKQAVKPRSTAFVWMSFVFFLLAVAGVVSAYFASPEPRSGRTLWGIGFGIAATACIAVAMTLGARKRIRNSGLGRFEVWVQFHMVIGVVGFLTALAHAGFRLTGVFTTVLITVFAFEVLTGVLGQAIYMIFPRILTRLERNGLSKLIEDLHEEEIELARGIDELTHKSPPIIGDFVRRDLARAVGSLWTRLKKSYDPEKAPAEVRQRVALQNIPPTSQSTAERLIKDVLRLQDVRAQLWLHYGMKHWVVAHIAATGALAVFLTIHIASMLLFIL